MFVLLTAMLVGLQYLPNESRPSEADRLGGSRKISSSDSRGSKRMAPASPWRVVTHPEKITGYPRVFFRPGETQSPETIIRQQECASYARKRLKFHGIDASPHTEILEEMMLGCMWRREQTSGDRQITGWWSVEQVYPDTH